MCTVDRSGLVRPRLTRSGSLRTFAMYSFADERAFDPMDGHWALCMIHLCGTLEKVLGLVSGQGVTWRVADQDVRHDRAVTFDLPG
jgi:hypothetical protein